MRKIFPVFFVGALLILLLLFKTGSTQKVINVELCSNCHPFYTGKQKLVDTARRVDKFQKRLAEHKKVAGTRAGKRVKRAKKQALTVTGSAWIACSRPHRWGRYPSVAASAPSGWR